MHRKLASRQGARPALLSPTKRIGVPRPLCRSYVLDKWRQLRNTLFALARPPTPTPCSSSKRAREDENDIGRYHSEHEIGETQAIEPLGGKGNSKTRTCEVRGKLVEAPAGIGGIRVVGQRSSARCHYRGSQGSSRLPPCITRGGSTQQRRPYSKDGFGGGQHFPHSDHEQDSLGLFGNDHRRAIKPERIIIVRHGESLGNFDESVREGEKGKTTYVHVPDWKIPLTKKGFVEGKRAGQKIKEVIGDKPLFIYTSPYLRTKQTLAGMVEAFDTNYIVGVREEPRLTEQQFGNFQNLTSIVESKAERARFGRFYYRFPLGESGLDVYNRATSFIATMFRDFANQNIAREDLNVIIVTHGLTLRLLVMRWFQYSIADFEQTINPANGAFVVMERRSKKKTESRFFESTGERRDLGHWYELTPESRAHINFGEQRQFGSLWKLLSELPDEPGVVPQEFLRHAVKEDAASNPDDKKSK